MSADAATGPFCGAMGCTADADVRVRHPDHGPIVVCAEHARDYEVIGDV